MSERTGPAASGYRYGFNGKEKDDEFSVEDGSYDFGARMYDARLGRWWSVDPEFDMFPSFSTFNYGINCVIAILDPDGKKLKIANAPNSEEFKGNPSARENYEIGQNDIISLLGNYVNDPEIRAMLSIDNDGNVEFSISEDAVVVLNDPGVTVLYEMVKSEKSYVYQVSGSAEYLLNGQVEGKFLDAPFFNGETDPDTKEPIPDNYQVWAASRTPRTYKKQTSKYYEAMSNSVTPLDPNVDAQVWIAPNTKFVWTKDEAGPMNRGSIVLHEMLEIFNSTEFEMPYKPEPEEGYPKGAHTEAISTAKTLGESHPLYSQDPGEAFINPNPDK